MLVVVLALSACTLSVFDVDDRDPDGGAADESPITFEQSYRVEVLEILAEVDTNGDGLVDNHLPEGLELLDLAVPDSGFGLEAFNERLAEHVTELRPVYLDARIAGGLEIDVSSEGASTTLSGAIADDGEFDVGPGDVVLDVILRDDLPSVSLGLLESRMSGTLDDGVSGVLRTLISIDSVVEDVIAPSIPDEGWDMNRDGTPETKDEVMQTVSSLAVLLADDALEDGGPAISAVLGFEAAEE